MSREQFLQYVRTYIEADPEAAPHVAGYVQAGLNAALAGYLRRCTARMPCAAKGRSMNRKDKFEGQIK